MQIYYIAGFVVIFMLSLTTVTTVILPNGQITYTDQGISSDLQDDTGDLINTYTTNPETYTTIDQAQQGGVFGFIETVTVSVVYPYNTFSMLLGCGCTVTPDQCSDVCNSSILPIAWLFTGIIYFIYLAGILQFVLNRGVKSMA